MSYSAEIREELARILEIVARDGLDGPRDLDVALDAIMCTYRDGPLRRLSIHLVRSRTILANMASERTRPWQRLIRGRWPIHHEPLRIDAQQYLPLLDEAIELAKDFK